ncbi:hypothetical protein R1sor_012593 [Riccia sorocarpa]|uniref:Reverse transcriptase domain-containing protein n=1 Tax=Riccia sorocarpa TaxID=122646 RepID=A0ABD3I882_9MARC
MEGWRMKLERNDNETNREGFRVALEMDRNLIRNRIGSFYKKLFREENAGQNSCEEMREVLGLINKRVSQGNNAKLEVVPSDQELEECVQKLAKDKAPGLDGISADVLREMWETAKPLCKLMLEAFWEDEELTGAEKKGVIKLLAKNDEKCRLENWRPITLLGITYKLANKIIADRIKPLLPGLISGQQTGFIPGRTIFDNILTLKLGEEWAVASGQEAIFLKLDFVKAYDRCEGIKVNNLSQLVHSLFADDMGLCLNADEDNFKEAKNIIEKFERISGAQLNVAKSLIIPLGMENIPRWILETGCRVVAEGDVWTYLGTPVGVKVGEDQLETFLLEKLTRRVNHWSNRMLTWEGRCIVLKHAIATMPNYYFMTLGLSTNGYKKLERICWQFLWGKNGEGGHKKSLVSWNRICREKEEGGLGICTFRTQAQTLKMRLISRILEGDNAEWTGVAKELIEMEFNRKKINRGKERTAQEILLLENPGRISHSVTMKNMLQGWTACRSKLQLTIRETKLNKGISLELLTSTGELNLGKHGGGGGGEGLESAEKTM